MSKRRRPDRAIRTALCGVQRCFRQLHYIHIYSYFRRQYHAIRAGGWPVLWSKASRACRGVILVFPAVIVVLMIRAVRPWRLIRINPLLSSRIGHLAANTEMYLCERDAGINVPKGRYVDLCFHAYMPLANNQLARMWRRHLKIVPAWLLGPAHSLNRLIPGGAVHEVGTNTQHDRDVHNLLDRTPPHLSFTTQEESRAQRDLRSMGIPEGGEFICLVARDDSYLKTIASNENYDYHNYRNVNVQNFVLAAEAFAERGYYVIRMGAVVKEPLKSTHANVIDYATNGMRSDFLDMYLAAKCMFCFSVGTGIDSVSYIFRRPIAYVNAVPLGYLNTFQEKVIFLSKKHWSVSEKRFLTLEEIFRRDLAFCLSSSEFSARGVEVVENTPEEIRSVGIEMVERLKGTWKAAPEDDALQRGFIEIYCDNLRDPEKDMQLHGAIVARYGAQFLRDNPEWLARSDGAKTLTGGADLDGNSGHTSSSLVNLNVPK